MTRLRTLTVVGGIDNAVSRATGQKAEMLQRLRDSIMDVIHRHECVYWDELIEACRPIVAEDTLSLLLLVGETIKEPE